MKGNISLRSFIAEVKEELRATVDNVNPFFDIGEVELEVSFTLNVQAKGGVKLVVVNAGASTEASQTHKVKLKLTPFVLEDAPPGGTPKKRTRGKAHAGFTAGQLGAVALKKPAEGKAKFAPQAKRGSAKAQEKRQTKRDRGLEA
jgi:hypothetical protein